MSYDPNDPTPQWIQEVGGHSCPKHGRYYGTCASCTHEQKKKDEHDTLLRLYRERDTAHARIAELEAQADDYKRGMLADRARVAELEAVLREWVFAVDTEYDTVATVGALSRNERACLARARALLEGK